MLRRQQKGWQQLLKRGLCTLSKDQYQLMWVAEGLVVEPRELAALKIIRPSEKFGPNGRLL